MSVRERFELTTCSLENGGYRMVIKNRRQRIQQRWDARLLGRLSQNTAPAKAAPKRPGRL